MAAAHEHLIASPPPGLRVWLLAHPPRTRGEPAVRALLSGHWGVPAERIPIERGEHGRPCLRAPYADLDAGWSHSGERMLVALAPGIRLGVDLEFRQPRPRAMELARRFFHPDETAWLEALPPERREALFVRLWCAKEAVLKAHGQGISFGLHRLRFAADGADGRSESGPGGTLRLQDCDPRLGAAGAWALREWSPAPGYRAALAWHPRQA